MSHTPSTLLTPSPATDAPTAGGQGSGMTSTLADRSWIGYAVHLGAGLERSGAVR